MKSRIMLPPDRSKIPDRFLLGPGPSNVHPGVVRAMATPVIGHLDPAFLRLMEEIKVLLRYLFQTENEFTIPLSGTGSAGMEACLVNFIEEGDEVIIGVNGVFGSRMVDVVERCGGKAITVETPWGRIIEPIQFKKALARCHRPKLAAVVHAETSTGAWQPLEEISSMVRGAGALFVVDVVTSLGGCPVNVDAWGIDAGYSATQKCLSCPPGLSPVTVNRRALEVVHRRRKKVQSWYLDFTLLEKYWGEERVYHHTAPISMNYALREALRLIVEEGLEQRFRRHRQNHRALVAGLQALGLQMAAQEGHRLWMLNSVAIPAGVDDKAVRRSLLEEFHIEIGGGLGPLAGKIWRIGLMGESSTKAHVFLVLGALETILPRHGCKVSPGVAVAAAQQVYASP